MSTPDTFPDVLRARLRAAAGLPDDPPEPDVPPSRRTFDRLRDQQEARKAAILARLTGRDDDA